MILLLIYVIVGVLDLTILHDIAQGMFTPAPELGDLKFNSDFSEWFPEK